MDTENQSEAEKFLNLVHDQWENSYWSESSSSVIQKKGLRSLKVSTVDTEVWD